jgi:hypothetical protein
VPRTEVRGHVNRAEDSRVGYPTFLGIVATVLKGCGYLDYLQ